MLGKIPKGRTLSNICRGSIITTCPFARCCFKLSMMSPLKLKLSRLFYFSHQIQQSSGGIVI